MTTYNIRGHTCPTTHRIALSLPEFFQLPIAVSGFFYNVHDAERGQDPWHLLDGIRMHTEGGGADICFHGSADPMVVNAEQFAAYCVYVADDAPVPLLEEMAAPTAASPSDNARPLKSATGSMT